MKIGLYGLPCAGKSTILKTINFYPVIDGSKKLHEYPGTIDVKRAAFLSDLKNAFGNDFFIDCHYQFVKNTKTEIVFTWEDEILDVILYLYQDPKVTLGRMEKSEKNQKYLPATEESLTKWQKEEIDALREICHKKNKDFYVIDNYENGYAGFIPFCKEIVSGFSSVEAARAICKEINFEDKTVTLLDGDKTITEKDTACVIFNARTHTFDTNVYTGYQFWKFDKEIKRNITEEYIRSNIGKVGIRVDFINSIHNPVIISSGFSEIWEKVIGKDMGIQTFAGININSDTKFFITKFLKEKGYKVNAFGDSKNDLYMLKEADNGTLIVNKHLSRSITYEEIENLNIKNENHKYLFEDEKNSEKSEIGKLISITKSNSGINGNPLAIAHMELGKKLAVYLKDLNPMDTTIVSFERSGHFLADGLYLGFNGKFVTYNSKFQEFPEIKTRNIILVDGVINSGKSIFDAIELIKKQNPEIKIHIVTNVINFEAAIKLAEYKLYAVRYSHNKFKGTNVAVQKGGVGPDTADRLFNQLDSYVIPEMEISINNKCNLRCKECGFLTPNQPSPALTQDVIEEHYNCLKILEDKNIQIQSLAILGGEPLLDSGYLERAVEKIRTLKNIKQIELVTNGLLPQNLTETTLSGLNKISVSTYEYDNEFMKTWKDFVSKKNPEIKIEFRLQKKWDLNSGNITVDEEMAQNLFDECWYKKHCVTIERSKLFVCSMAPKHKSDSDGLHLSQELSFAEIVNYMERPKALNHCSKCIPAMKLGKVDGGVQSDNRCVKTMMIKAKEYMKNNLKCA